MIQKSPQTLNICSDFHLGRHFFGLVGGFFVGHSVTLLMNQRNVYAFFFTFPVLIRVNSRSASIKWNRKTFKISQHPFVQS